MSLLAELKRRNVFKVGAAYLVVGWLVIEVASVLAPQLSLPEWAPRMITFVVLLGFPIALVLAWIFDMTPEGVQVTSGKGSSGVFYTIVAVLAAAGLGWFFMGGSEETPDAAPEPVAVVGAPERSIAVLPFVALSTSEDDRYFGQGIAEELLNALARFPDLEVAARTSAFAFDGQDVDLRQVGEALNVAHVLEGSVRRSGDRLRITAQLIRVSDGFHLWSETYERTSADVFDIQDDIVRELSRNLQLRLGVGAGAGRAEERTTNPRAYEAYLQGLYLFGRREGDGESRRGGYSAFRLATELDPMFADAWASLAMALTLSGSDMAQLSPDEYRLLVVQAFERALELDPENARAHAAKGLWYGWDEIDVARAEYHVRRALELAPNSVEPHYVSGLVATVFGDTEGAFRALERAVVLDPLNQTMHRVRAQVAAQSGRYSTSAAYFSACLESAEGDCGFTLHRLQTVWLGDSLCSGDAEAVSQLRDRILNSEIGYERNTHMFLAISEQVYGGDPVPDLDLSTIESPAWSFLGALWHANQGNLDHAFVLLDAGFEGGSFRAFNSTAFLPLNCPAMAYPEVMLTDSRYHAFWAQPGLAELAEVRRANGKGWSLPQ